MLTEIENCVWYLLNPEEIEIMLFSVVGTKEFVAERGRGNGCSLKYRRDYLLEPWGHVGGDENRLHRKSMTAQFGKDWRGGR